MGITNPHATRRTSRRVTLYLLAILNAYLLRHEHFRFPSFTYIARSTPPRCCDASLPRELANWCASSPRHHAFTNNSMERREAQQRKQEQRRNALPKMLTDGSRLPNMQNISVFGKILLLCSFVGNSGDPSTVSDKQPSGAPAVTVDRLGGRAI